MKIAPVFLFCVLVSCSLASADPEEITKRSEATLKPVVVYMDSFIRDHHRLPTQDEFKADTASMGWMLVLRDHTDKYAASKGAKADLDYMVGVWRADWYHYYKSWDRSFLNGSDEPL